VTAASRGTDAASGIRFGYRAATVRTRLVSTRIPVRLAVVSALLAAGALAAGVAALTIGDVPLALDRVAIALLGGGPEFSRMIVVEWRLPVAIAAVVFGALLGLGGAIFQSILRNPLGSPDVIGFDAGASAAVVVVMLVLGTAATWSIALAALAGGLGTALAVHLLAFRRGLQGFRLIVVGIAVAAVLNAVTSYLVTRADIDDAIMAGFWAAGSLGRVTWASLGPALTLAAVVAIAAVALSGGLRRLELGDDAAVTLGGRPGPVRLALVVTGVATVAIVTAAAGPIAFVALVSPQLARRLTGTAGVSLVASACTGALLLATAQLATLGLAQAFRPIPVGLVTVCLGGLYLMWLLVQEARRQYGAPR
jgi:iron complex transport system permease protein